MNAHEAEYLEVRKAWHASDGSMAARATAATESRRIARAARRAHATLDELGLDDQARRAVTR